MKVHQRVMGIEIKKLKIFDLEQFRDLVLVFEEAFEIHDVTPPSYDLLNKMLQRDNFHVFVASDGKEIIGGLTGYALDHYFGNSPLIFMIWL